MVRVVVRERGLGALVHGPMIPAVELGILEAWIRLPERLAEQLHALASEDACRLGVHVLEAPVASERKESFGDALEDLARPQLRHRFVGSAGRFDELGRVLDAVNDVFDRAVFIEHWGVDRRPPTFDELPFGRRQCVSLHRHDIG